MTEETLFASALEKETAAERAAFLDAACAGDLDLKGRVERLLQAHEAAGRFLEVSGGPPHGTETIASSTEVRDKPEPVSPNAIRYFGEYVLLEEIGRGGMGVVYKARQKSLARVVALKMILTGQLANDADVQRFHAEAEAAARLQHPGIVPVFEVGRHEGHHYFTMALIEGESLAHRLTEGVFAPQEAAVMTRKIARAVAYAHAEGVIHRDLKPGNILLDTRGEPHLTDFGLAKRVAAVGSADATAMQVQELTATGQILGTPSYMPPEQAGGSRGAIGPLSDVYSLGAILYCLLTGRPPFQAATPLETIMQVLKEEPVSPRQLNASVPRDLETICLKCLAKEPQKRYDSAQSLSADLERFATGQPIKARPLGLIGRGWRWYRRNPALAAAAGLAAAAMLFTVVLAVSFGVYQWNIGERDRRLLAESYYDKGQSFCEQGDVARGMLWLARSLETAPASANDLHSATRTNLKAWHVPSARLQKVFEHPQGVSAGFSPVCLRPDAKLLLAQANNGPVRIWDVETGVLKNEFAPNGWPNSGAFSPDGSLFVYGGPDTDRAAGVVATIWDTTTGQVVRSLKIPREDIPADGRNISASKTAFSPDGKIIATASYFRNVQLWDAATGSPLGPLLGSFPEGLHKDDIMALAVSPNGSRVATASRDSTARIWDARTGKPLCEPLNHGHFWLRAVAFSPDGKTLLTAGDTPPRLWDATTGKQLGEPLPVSNITYAATFSPDGRWILTGSGNSAQLWDLATRKQIGLAMNHYCNDGAVTFSADSKTIVTAGAGAICVWDVPQQLPSETVVSATGSIIAAVYNPNGAEFATASTRSKSNRWDCIIQIWDARTAKPKGPPIEIKQSVVSIAYSPDGNALAAAVNVGFKHLTNNSSEPAWEARVWNAADAQPAGPAIELWGQPGMIEFGSSSTTLTTTDYSHAWNNRKGMVRTWDVASGRLVGQPQPKPGSPGEFVHPDYPGPHGKRMNVINAGDNVLILNDAAMYKGLGQIYATGGIGPIAVSPNGDFLLTGGDKAQQLWDTASLKPIGTPREPAAAVAFSPDGKTILTGDGDGTLRLRSMPVPITGEIDRIALWVEVLTNSSLDRGSPARAPLTVKELSRRQEKLDQAGGPPLP